MQDFDWNGTCAFIRNTAETGRIQLSIAQSFSIWTQHGGRAGRSSDVIRGIPSLMFAKPVP